MKKATKGFFRHMEDNPDLGHVVTTSEIRGIFEALAFNTDYNASGQPMYLLAGVAEEGTKRRTLQEMFMAKYPDEITRNVNGHAFCWQLTNKILAKTEVWEAFISKPHDYTIKL